MLRHAQFLRPVWHRETALALSGSGAPAAHFRRRHSTQVFHRPIRLVRLKLFQSRAASGHGQYFCIDGPGAFDVKRRVADDEDLFAA